MNQLRYALRTIAHSPWSSLLKVVSIGLALAISVSLLTFAAYIVTSNTGYGDYGDLYEVYGYVHINETETRPTSQISGKIADPIREKLSEYIDGVTVTGMYSSGYIERDGKECHALSIGADTAFFSTMGIRILSGNPAKEFVRPNTAMVSERFLKEELKGNTDEKITFRGIGEEAELEIIGVYESPQGYNSVNPDVVYSLPTLNIIPSHFYENSWNSRGDNTVFVRIKDGADIESLTNHTDKFYKLFRPSNDQDRPTDIRLIPITEVLAIQGDDGSSEARMLTILGLVVLTVIILNYALLSISSVPQRAKNVSIHKCNGAGYVQIFGLFILETFIIVTAASIVATAFFYWGSSNLDESFVTTRQLKDIFSLRLSWVGISSVAVIIIIGGIIPARIIASLPVAHIFRKIRIRNNGWEKSLLFVELAVVGFVVAMVGNIGAQYLYLSNKNLGYNPEDLALIIMHDLNAARKADIETMVSDLPYVEGFTRSSSTPFWSNYNVAMKDDNDNELFRIQFDQIRDNYAEILGVTSLKGRMPRQEGEVAIDRSFAEALGWDIEEFDKKYRNEEIDILSQKNLKIVGVYENMQLGPFNSHHIPGSLIYTAPLDILFTTVKLKKPADQSIRRLKEDLGKYWDEEEITIDRYTNYLKQSMTAERTLRNIITATTVVVLLLVVMGLIGFLKNEINRSSKSIAIRKISGATSLNIYNLIGKKIMVLAVPAVIIGSAGAFLVSGMWFQQYDDVTSGLIPVTVGGAILIVSLIYLTVILLTRQTANANPVDSLRSE